MATDAQLFERRVYDKMKYAAIADEFGLNVDSVRSRVNRYMRVRIIELERENEVLKARDSELFGHDLGKPWELEGDWIIAGDIHCNTVNTDFMRRPLEIATRYLKKPRRFMIAGDFLNQDAWSGYENVYPLPSFSKELQSARQFLDMYLKVFDEIWMFVGNHDLRITRKSGTAIQPEDMMRMISHDTRVKVSHWGHALLNTARGVYRISHGSEYSIQQLNVADQMAQKYGQHIVLWHEHHTALGMDRFKRHVILNGGGLFDQSSMAYTQIEDNKRPNMANGFVMIRNGYPYLFSDHFTDWQFWLRDSEAIALDQQIFSERKAG
jgi:hypothetical protein